MIDIVIVATAGIPAARAPMPNESPMTTLATANGIAPSAPARKSGEVPSDGKRIARVLPERPSTAARQSPSRPPAMVV